MSGTLWFMGIIWMDFGFNYIKLMTKEIPSNVLMNVVEYMWVYVFVWHLSLKEVRKVF